MSLQQKRRLFQSLPGINLCNIMLTDSGMYSVCNPKYASAISEIIKSLFINSTDIVITDAAGNCGGNTINFAHWFKHVNVVEIAADTHAALVNNIYIYGLKNVSAYRADYTEMYNTIEQDVVYIDPPWGGPDYKDQSMISLTLGQYDLSEVCNMLHDHVKVIALKVPNNFDIYNLSLNIVYGQYSVYDIYGRFQLIVIHTGCLKQCDKLTHTE
jgi:predicted RNA methylase